MALASLVSSGSAYHLLQLARTDFVVQFPNPSNSPPDDLLTVQKDFCEQNRAARASEYKDRPYACTKCGHRYSQEGGLAKHVNRCDTDKIPASRAFTPASSSSSSASTEVAPSFPCPSSDTFNLQQVGVFFVTCFLPPRHSLPLLFVPRGIGCLGERGWLPLLSEKGLQMRPDKISSMRLQSMRVPQCWIMRSIGVSDFLSHSFLVYFNFFSPPV